jgi:hypothetical protein
MLLVSVDVAASRIENLSPSTAKADPSGHFFVARRETSLTFALREAPDGTR